MTVEQDGCDAEWARMWGLPYDKPELVGQNGNPDFYKSKEKKEAHQIIITRKPGRYKLLIQDDHSIIETVYCDDLVIAIRCALSHYDLSETDLP